jgi:SsrA-binding protein
MMKYIAQNKKAFHDYEVLEKLEAGISLTGAEVKSIRGGKVNLADSYAQSSSGELFLLNLHISPYTRLGFYTPDPYRKRKLLLKKKQIIYLINEMDRKQLTLIPLGMYFQKQWIKIELGLCRGLKKFDKRQKIAEEDSKRRLQQLKKW